MKAIILVIVLGAAAYYVLANHSPFQLVETDPHYAEIRVNVPGTSVQLVGFGKMHSKEDCLARSVIVWSEVFKKTGKLDLVKNDCNKELSPRYSALFENKPFHATYLVFEKGDNSERDGRFIIFGVPSSIVAKECSKIIDSAKTRYRGKVYCIQGTVG
jgi:hypothetical protein